jgi:hypothetical protein
MRGKHCNTNINPRNQGRSCYFNCEIIMNYNSELIILDKKTKLRGKIVFFM